MNVGCSVGIPGTYVGSQEGSIDGDPEGLREGDGVILPVT